MAKGKKISKHLTDWEVRCKCGCKPGAMTKNFLDKFEKMRAMIAEFYGYERPIIVTSVHKRRNGGNRCLAQNRKAKGARQSKHKIYPGIALDIFIPGMRQGEVAWWGKKAGFHGLGVYTNNAHVDDRKIKGYARWPKGTKLRAPKKPQGGPGP